MSRVLTLMMSHVCEIVSSSSAHLCDEDLLRLPLRESYPILLPVEALEFLDIMLTNSFFMHRSAWSSAFVHFHSRSLVVRSTLLLSIHLHL